ncbi:MAG: ATP-binding domain-containing protein, partial [Tidjanibacter sp.]|nr:ATP-binding domain-containing protein [Tidjanibacter sp.]
NNYHYTERDEDAKAAFIANGDVACLRRIRRFKELYGFRFAEATLRFGDYDDYEIECNILLDTLNSTTPSLTREQMKELFYAIEGDYADQKCKAKRYKEVREDPYYNAMQIKFAYAVTCHKSQGGQWSAVFIDRLLFGEERMNKEFLRWLYTAISRATEQVYLVNFDDSFFDPTTYTPED